MKGRCEGDGEEREEDGLERREREVDDDEPWRNGVVSVSACNGGRLRRNMVVPGGED